MNVTTVSAATECFPNTVRSQLLLYIVFGAVMIACNAMILLTIFRHGILRDRKEYIILAGLALADSISGWSSLLSGVKRWQLYSTCSLAKIPRSECITHISVLLMGFGLFFQGVMLLVVTLDRLIGVIVPLRYYTLSATYAWRLVGVAYLIGTVFVGYGLGVSLFDETTMVSPSCLLLESFGLHYYFVYFANRFLLAVLSVGLYVVVVVVFLFCRKGAWQTGGEQMKHQRRMQRRLIVTVGICCATTTFFDAVPTATLLFAKVFDLDLTAVAFYIWPTYCTNAVLNVFIYNARHADMRAGFLYLWRCKELPPNFNPNTAKVNATRTSMDQGEMMTRRLSVLPAP